MKRRTSGLAMMGAGALLLAAAAFVNYEALTEAYGSGPPYYSRSTNMDKWRDPLPELLVADALIVLVAGLLFRGGARRVR